MPEIKSNPIRYSEFKEVYPVHRGDDIVIPKPYAGVAVFRDGRYIIAGRDRGLLVLVGPDDLVISSGDPLSVRFSPKPIICYGIALNIDEQSLYLLIGEGEDSNELYITRIEILPDNTFKWFPSFDIRLPSVVARNEDYDTYYPIYWGYYRSHHTIGATALQWLTCLFRKSQPEVFQNWSNYNDWSLLKDKLAIELTNFPMLGPVLPEYKPSMTGVGARVMVSCTNVQLYQASYDMQMWFDWGRSTFDYTFEKMKERVMSSWISHLKGVLYSRGIEKEWDEVFPYGKEDGWWWVDNETNSWYGATLHQKVTFQYPFPASSVVTLYPDLGMIDGIAQTGSPLVCAVPKDGEINEAWHQTWPYPPALHTDHVNENKYLTTNIMAAEADIELLLARNEYIIPSNVLSWAEMPPWQHVGITVYDSYVSFFDWWVDIYFKQIQTDPIEMVRKYPQDQTPVLMGLTKENKLCQTRRDGARKGVSAATTYKAESLVYPWSVIDGVMGSCTEICTGNTMMVTPDKIYRGDLVLHRLISTYKGRYLGEGLDIYVGKVLLNKPKEVEVIFQHAGYPLVQLKNITISIIPDNNYPYYKYVKLSLDEKEPRTWSDSITFKRIQLCAVHPGIEESNYQFKFWVKVECDSTIEDPKPVIVKTTYERVGS